MDWKSDEEVDALADELRKPMDHDTFAKKVADKRFTYYVSVSSRLGFAALSACVEYRKFHPNVGPESNDDFLFMFINFEGLLFTAFGVPEKFESYVRECADAILMRVADGLPLMIGPNGPVMFPGSTEAKTGRYNLYSIENTAGSQVYLNRQDLNKAIDDRERQVVDGLMIYGDQVPMEFIRDFLWIGSYEPHKAS